MKKTFSICLIVLSFAFHTAAQQIQAKSETTTTANPADVSSMDAILRSIYEVISGEAGQKRDWNRSRSLFHTDARMIPTGKNPNTGIIGARSLTPEKYIKRNEPFMEKEGFFEREIARRVETYGSIAHVFSTYESFHKASDKTPFARGINSFQLLNDGKRWWVMTIMWQGETLETMLPKKYLKNKS